MLLVPLRAGASAGVTKRWCHYALVLPKPLVPLCAGATNSMLAWLQPVALLLLALLLLLLLLALLLLALLLLALLLQAPFKLAGEIHTADAVFAAAFLALLLVKSRRRKIINTGFAADFLSLLLVSSRRRKVINSNHGNCSSASAAAGVVVALVSLGTSVSADVDVAGADAVATDFTGARVGSLWGISPLVHLSGRLYKHQR
eukprot:g42010.t1